MATSTQPDSSRRGQTVEGAPPYQLRHASPRSATATTRRRPTSAMMRRGVRGVARPVVSRSSLLLVTRPGSAARANRPAGQRSGRAGAGALPSSGGTSVRSEYHLTDVAPVRARALRPGEDRDRDRFRAIATRMSCSWAGSLRARRDAEHDRGEASWSDQPRKTTVGRSARVPIIAIATGTIRTTVRLSSVNHDLPVEVVEAGPRIAAPNTTNVAAFSSSLPCSRKCETSLPESLRSAPNRRPPTNAAMKVLPPKPTASPEANTAAAKV